PPIYTARPFRNRAGALRARTHSLAEQQSFVQPHYCGIDSDGRGIGGELPCRYKKVLYHLVQSTRIRRTSKESDSPIIYFQQCYVSFKTDGEVRSASSAVCHGTLSEDFDVRLAALCRRSGLCVASCNCWLVARLGLPKCHPPATTKARIRIQTATVAITLRFIGLTR